MFLDYLENFWIERFQRFHLLLKCLRLKHFDQYLRGYNQRNQVGSIAERAKASFLRRP